ncbi:hypothetical protein CDLVIII_2688 [Clostridium sp. DL-VIII]|uniref:hypothetical protein n=1 Tax=Clostridium sp. DL-VIII TaxID=641107 RepID=UPI00023B0217|nr:hypothetical protein [Clostridium sp. DL-VIII]EHI99289.1 hypothetical protein CDLVIII_2688 [Clostridium sp. DL-VIII]
MFIDNDFSYDDNMNFQNFEFCEDNQMQRAPFPGGGNFHTGSNPDYSPNFNFPGGTFDPPGMPKSPPPNYIPKKNESGVQKMAASGGAETFAVSQNSIKFCLYKYTYIWEVSGRNYWAFLLNVDRRTVSGFRWFRRSWVYFGVDLRRIDSFVCYRSTPEDTCENCVNLNQKNTESFNLSKEYYQNGSRDIFSRTLTSIDMPQTKEDFIENNTNYLDDTDIKNNASYIKTRDISYRITLEVSYPSSYTEDSKNKINEFANEASIDALNAISATRSIEDVSSNPLEIYTSSLQLIPEALRAFSDSFNGKVSSLEDYNDIQYSIRSEKIYTNWRPYFYNA